MKQQLSPSRIKTMLACNRKHFWRYEVGFKPDRDAQALRFGSAMHRALEARLNGAVFVDALHAGIGDATQVEELDIAVLSALLAGYYERYKEESIGKVFPEIEIVVPIPFSRFFEGVCVLDGLGTLKDGRKILVEHKTTSEDISDGSKYWDALKYDVQLPAYLDGARAHGWDLDCVIYDVIRKPKFELSKIPVLDDAGLKIVEDVNGQRILLANGKPRQAPDAKEGWFLKTRLETCEELCDRLTKDIKERPEYYFARKEIPVLDDEIQEFRAMRDAVARQIVQARREQERYDYPEYSWPRCVGRFTCMNCDFSGFCLQGIHADIEHIPSGLKIDEKRLAINAGLE